MRYSIRSHTPDSMHNRQGLMHSKQESRSRNDTDQPELAVLVSVILPQSKADLRDPLGELTALAESANTEIVDKMTQKRMKIGTAYALGKGKLRELAERVEANNASVVIFDNDLTPRQIRGLEKELQIKVIDRTELILDIFASRASSHEAQLQVELAQLQYTAPRIRGMWTHLERVAGAGGATAAGAVGGVGTRGPGERQIEIDRRLVQKRISHLKGQIAEIDRRKQREARSRTDQFTVSLVGYTNSGKTTLLNRLTGTECYAADRLFATLDTKTCRWDLGEGRGVLLSDTVGFIRDLPHHLVASFRATLEETIHADLLLHVVDISSPSAYQQMEAVDSVLQDLGCADLPQLTLLNKIDAINDTSMAEFLAQHRSDSLEISALTGQGLDNLSEAILQRMLGATAQATIRLDQSEGKLLAEIAHHANVSDRRYMGNDVELDLSMNQTQFLQLCARFGSINIVRTDEQTRLALEFQEDNLPHTET